MTSPSSAAPTLSRAAEPLLDHAIRTRPEPLTASASGSPVELWLTVSTEFVAVRCTSIVIELPVGNRPRDLVATGDGIEALALTPGWSVASEDVGPTRARFEFRPAPEAEVIREDPVSFKLEGVVVNPSVGVAYPSVIETSATVQETPVPREGFVRLPKFPAGATGSKPVGTNLRVYAGEESIAGRPPAVRVPYGGKVTVAWNPLRDVVQHLHYEDRDAGTAIRDGQTQLVCGPLHRETTFTMQTVSQVGGQPVNRYDTYTVQVDVPEYPRVTLPNGSLRDVGSAGLRITSPVTTAKTLTVKEAMAASDTATISALTAPTVEASTTQFSGTLAVSGTFTADNLTAHTVTTTDGLATTGRVDILKATHTPLAASGTQTFTTDGLILVNVHNRDALEVQVTTPSHTFKNLSRHKSGTLIAPVKAGQEVTWGANASGAGADYTVHWYPFGV